MAGPQYPIQSHLRVSWGGSLGSPQADIWTNSLAFHCTGGDPSEVELANIAVDVAPAITTLISGFAPAVSPAVYLDWIKAVWVGPNGKQRDVNTAMYVFPTNTRPKGTASPVQWFQTYAVTLRTSISRGRGHAGRIFPPPCGAPPTGETPYATQSFATDLAATYASGITAMAAAIQLRLDPNGAAGQSNQRSAKPCIVSRPSVRNPTPMLTEINRVVVDRVADVQHRRTNRVARSEGAPALV